MAESSTNPFVFVSYPRLEKKFVKDVVQVAQSTYEQLPSDTHRQLARMLFLRLIRLNEIEREMVELQPRRVFITDLVLSDVERTSQMRDVFNAFADANTLIFGELNEQGFLSVNHEILLQEWAILHIWIQEEGLDTIRLYHRISASTSDWQLRGYAKEVLYRGKMLEEALDLVAKMLLNEAEEKFLKASMKEQGTQFNWEIAKMAAIGVGLVGTAVAAVKKMQVDTQLVQKDTQLQKTRYWRNKHSRDLRKLRKTIQKEK